MEATRNRISTRSLVLRMQQIEDTIKGSPIQILGGENNRIWTHEAALVPYHMPQYA